MIKEAKIITMQAAIQSKRSEALNIFKFTLPIIFTNLFQQMFSVIDQLIVSSYGGDLAVAAIGATVSPVAVFTNFIVGTAVGASAVIAQRRQ